LQEIAGGRYEAVYHEAAITDTTVMNQRLMIEVNTNAFAKILEAAHQSETRVIYASSAGTYGNSAAPNAIGVGEDPENIYGFSKLLMDRIASRWYGKHSAPIIGLRYFNVYGPGEAHKKGMASVVFHFNNQIINTGVCNLFEGNDQYKNGEQLRDFVYVEDVVKVNLWFWKNKNISGIYNCGSGRAQSFNDVANAVINYHGQGKINYISFPEKLKGAYQNYTKADLTKLRNAGYTNEFKTVEQAVPEYLTKLN